MTTDISVRAGQPKGLLGAVVRDPSGRPVALSGSACQACGALFFPSVIRCRQCGADAIAPRSLSGIGEVYSFTVARVGLSGFRTPYAFGYVTLAEGPRVFARLLDRDGGEDGLQVGAPVTLAEAPIALTDPDRTVPGIVFQVSGPEEG